MTNTTSTNFGSTLAIEYSKKQSSIKDFLTLENFAILFSSIGPILSILFLAFILPLAIEFNSISNGYQLHKFTDENLMVLIKLMYLLFASGLFSLFGLMLYYVYKKNVLLIFNFISFFIAFGMFIPTYIMVIGD